MHSLDLEICLIFLGVLEEKLLKDYQFKQIFEPILCLQ